MKRMIVVCAALMALTGCAKKDDWTAFVFPNRDDMPLAPEVEKYIQGKYSSFDECQSAAVAAVRQSDERTGLTGDYDCGFKCTIRPDMGGLLICKTDRK